MAQIVDVSPTSANASTAQISNSVTGRMLSIASPDGESVYVGSYSNIWASSDGGKNFAQLTWPQPESGQFEVPGAIGGWGVVDIAAAIGWRVDEHPRFLARLTASGHDDIVGFGDCGVWTALGNGDGSFQKPRVVINNFGYNAGGWRVDTHPRFVLDINGDGLADIVGFGDAGVWTAIGKGDGTFEEPQLVLENFGTQQGWQVDNPRFLAVLTKSGFPDIVGFGNAGVWTALGDGHGSFKMTSTIAPVLDNFSVAQGWQVDQHPRFVLDLNGDGFADIVGFGEAGVWTAIGDGHGSFKMTSTTAPVLANFGTQQGWQVNHPRFLAVLTKGGFPDIVGFGDAGVWTALGDGHGSFKMTSTTAPVLANFGVQQGWQVDEHPRFLAVTTASGLADIVGFGNAGVWTATSKGDGTFTAAVYVLANFGVQQGWQVARHPRLLAHLTGEHNADIVAFGDAGVWTAPGDGNAGFPNANFVLASFAYGTTVLAITVNDLAKDNRGIWRSSDGGATWTLVHQFATNNPSVGQLQWALGSDHLVYAAGGSSIAISQDGGMTFTDVVPWAPAPPNSAEVNHIAVWQNAPADLAPQVMYALGPSTMWLSFDGGTNWIKDRTPAGPLPQFPGSVGAPASIGAESNTSTVMVISPRNPLEVFVAQDGSGSGGVAAALYSGDYSQFPFGTLQSAWVKLPLPSNLEDPNTQDSGNVFLLTTQKGRGDLLFYGAQHYHDPGDFQSAQASVGPLSPASGSDWHQLGLVHVDLHGFLLSPDFAATIEPGGNYHPGTGTAWILSDGGIDRSTDGGNTFNRSAGATTLACLSVAGVSNAGSGPALCINEGDNDGFYSTDDGKNWSYLDYQGGDNDCAFADPLRSFSMLVQTPRWDHTVTVYEASPGNLPNAGNGTGQRHTVPGPAAPNDWNAAGFFGNRGTKPIVHSVAGVPPPPQGDYIFVLNPQSPQPGIVRTQNIRDITSSSEWVTTATGPGQGANVYRYGPSLPAPSSNLVTNPSMGIVQASGGHINTIVYAGGDGTLWTWEPGAENWTQIVPGSPGKTTEATSAMRFFVSPYQPNVIYIVDFDHVRRSDDSGLTWNVDSNLELQLTWNHQIPVSITDSNGLITDNTGGVGDFFDVLISDMKFDPNNPLIRFAVGRGGAFYTNDGVNWIRLLHTGALSGRPTSCYYDFITNPDDPALYVAFAGRSVVKISQLPQSTVP